MYLDGSLRDGPSDQLGRAGWGFAALDRDGSVRAAAFGVPPPWIRSIHGAEMWAFFAALRCAIPGVAFRSDRQAVVDTFRRGAHVATGASVEHARLWILIYAACDDYENPHTDLTLEWMLAHTTEAHVGVASLSNGQLLTTHDRAGNALADTLAKRGAEFHRVPETTRTLVSHYSQLALWSARALAVRTFAANHLEVPGAIGLRRDSAGVPRRRRRHGSARDAASPQAQPVVRPDSAAKRSRSSSCSSEEVPLDDVGAGPRSQACRRRARTLGKKAVDAQRLQVVCRAVAERLQPRKGMPSAADRIAEVQRRVRARLGCGD